MQYPPTLHDEQWAGHTIFSHVVPFALYPSLHDTAVQIPVNEQAVQVPLLTLMLGQALQLLALAGDHVPEAQGVQDVAVPPSEYVPDGHAAHELPFTYCPAGQVILSHLKPVALYPSLHDTAVQVPVDEQAVHTPLEMEMVEQALHVLPLKYSPVGQVIFSHLVPFALYPSLHDTAVQVPVDEQAVQVPFSTAMAEHG